MDPNTALAELRSRVENMHSLLPDPDADWTAAEMEAQLLIEQFEALDEWLTKGGFKPSAWETTIVLNRERQFAERSFDRHADEAVALGNSGTLPAD